MRFSIQHGLTACNVRLSAPCVAAHAPKLTINGTAFTVATVRIVGYPEIGTVSLRFEKLDADCCCVRVVCRICESAKLRKGGILTCGPSVRSYLAAAWILPVFNQQRANCVP